MRIRKKKHSQHNYQEYSSQNNDEEVSKIGQTAKACDAEA